MWPHGSCTPNIGRNLSIQITLSPENKLRIAARYDGHFGYSGVRWRALPTFFASVMSSRHTMHVLSPDCTKRAKWERAKWERAEWERATWERAKRERAKWERATWERAKWERAKWDRAACSSSAVASANFSSMIATIRRYLPCCESPTVHRWHRAGSPSSSTVVLEYPSLRSDPMTLR